MRNRKKYYHRSNPQEVNNYLEYKDRERKLYKKLLLLFILFYATLGIQWIVLCFPTIGRLVVLLVSHFDLTSFIALETFILANLTAFIAIYEFLEKKLHREKGKEQN